MPDNPLSALRRRMLEDMIVRKFGEKTGTTISAISKASLGFSAARPTRRPVNSRQRLFERERR